MYIHIYIYICISIYIYIYTIYIYIHTHIHATVYVIYMYIYFFSLKASTHTQSSITIYIFTQCYCENPVFSRFNLHFFCDRASSDILPTRLFHLPRPCGFDFGESWTLCHDFGLRPRNNKNRHPESVMGKSSHTLW